MITAYMALRIRNNGLLLPVKQEYSNPRLKEIAVRMCELYGELIDLDIEIVKISDGEKINIRIE
jgi:LytS/YehU family sensor histidine kinase